MLANIASPAQGRSAMQGAFLRSKADLHIAYDAPGENEGAQGALMIFEQIATGGCQSYFIGCTETCAAAIIDPEVSQIDRYLGVAARNGVRVHYVIDTHTHADHFSATDELAKALDVPVVMHRD